MFLFVQADELLGEQLVLEPARQIGLKSLAKKAANGAQNRGGRVERIVSMADSLSCVDISRA